MARIQMAQHRPVICTRMRSPYWPYRYAPRLWIEPSSIWPSEEVGMTPRQARAFARAIVREADRLERSVAKAKAKRP